MMEKLVSEMISLQTIRCLQFELGFETASGDPEHVTMQNVKFVVS